MLLNVSRGSVTGTGVFHEKYVPQLYGQTIFPALYDRRGICHQEQGTESHHQVQCPVPPFLSPTVVFFLPVQMLVTRRDTGITITPIINHRYLGIDKDHDSVTSRALTLLNLESPQARKILRNMATDGILIAQKKLEQ